MSVRFQNVKPIRSFCSPEVFCTQVVSSCALAYKDTYLLLDIVKRLL
ncbi:MAG TPA: hypothetical protein VNJ09_09140 [Chthonomonadales bacterium]|nr:hypothetical protein [Chthonomonadales bacterium]